MRSVLRVLTLGVLMLLAALCAASAPSAGAQQGSHLRARLTLGRMDADWAQGEPAGIAADVPYRLASVNPGGPVLEGRSDSEGRIDVPVPAEVFVLEAGTKGGYWQRSTVYGAPAAEFEFRLSPPIPRPSLLVKVIPDCGEFVVPRLAQVTLSMGGPMARFDRVDANDEVYFDFMWTGPAVLSFGFVYGETKQITVAPTGTTVTTLKITSGNDCTAAPPTTPTTAAPPSKPTTTTTITTTTTTEPETTPTGAEEPSTTTSGVAPTETVTPTEAVTPTTIAPEPTTTIPPPSAQRPAPGAQSSPATSTSSSSSTTAATTPDPSDAVGGGGRTIALAAGLGGPTIAGLGFAALRYRRRQPLP